MGFGGFFSRTVMSVEDNHTTDPSLRAPVAMSATD
jgi:hypothetical protein